MHYAEGNTEWMETLEGGWNVLAGADKCGIIEVALGRRLASRQGKIFGCENAGDRISGIIADISG